MMLRWWCSDEGLCFLKPRPPEVICKRQCKWRETQQRGRGGGGAAAVGSFTHIRPDRLTKSLCEQAENTRTESSWSARRRCYRLKGGGVELPLSWHRFFLSLPSPSWFRQVRLRPDYQSSERSLEERRGRYHAAAAASRGIMGGEGSRTETDVKGENVAVQIDSAPIDGSSSTADEKAERREQRSVGRRGGGTYLSSACSGKPAAASAARYCSSTPRTLFTNPLESGKSGKPMSG